MISALPRLHGYHQLPWLGPTAVRHVLPPTLPRERTLPHRVVMAFALAMGVAALLLTVAAFALTSRITSDDHPHPVASPQAAPTAPAPARSDPEEPRSRG